MRNQVALIKDTLKQFSNDEELRFHVSDLPDICHKLGANLDPYELYFLAYQSNVI